MTDAILHIIHTTAADTPDIAHADIDAGLAQLRARPLCLNPDRLTFTQAVISAYILADLVDDEKNVHRYVDHHVKGWTSDKAATLGQTEAATLERCVALIAASGERAA